MFNARRGGEPAKLKLNEWDDIKKNAWIDPEIVKQLKPEEKARLDKFRVCTRGLGGTHIGRWYGDVPPSRLPFQAKF